MSKCNYFYIDESGSILNDSPFFVHGCIKTESPRAIQDALERLKSSFENSLYYAEFSERIKSEGFHATENHFDMRADVYKLVPLLNYRSYFVILNKKSDYFKKLIKEKNEHEIFLFSLMKLLKDRIERNKKDKNIFVFENIQISKKPLNKILEELFGSLGRTYDCTYTIVGKEEQNLGVIDYLNFIFSEILSKRKGVERMKMNFNLIAPKIGVISFLNNNVYLSRKKSVEFQVNFENLLKQFDGSPG